MGRKKKILVFLGILLFCFGLLAAGLFADRLIHTRFPHITLDASGLSLSEEAPLSPGEALPLSFTVENRNYTPVQIRQSVVLSLYDKTGAPLPMDGTGFSQSSYELYYPTQLTGKEDGPLIPQGPVLSRKAVQGNQSVYVTEYTLDAAQPFYCPQPKNSGNTSRTEEYALLLNHFAGEAYPGCILRLDILIEGKLEDGWVLLRSYTDFSGTVASEDILSSPAKVPSLTAPVSFRWKIRDGAAYLQGIGNVTDRHVVLPSRVWLREDGTEDPLEGTPYPVIIHGNAFNGCETISTVTFEDGAAVLDNQMHRDGEGMFQNCPNLTAVYNLPDNVISMESAFRNCTALGQIPSLPGAVAQMDHCFSGCTALEGSVPIPMGVIDPEDASALGSIYENCPSLDAIEVSYCPDVIDPAVISETIPVRFVADHASSGLCPVCRFGSIDTVIDGLNVVIDRAPEEFYKWFLDYVDNQVPDLLKPACARLTLTDDLTRYNAYYSDPRWDGFSTRPDGLAYIKILDPSCGTPEERIFEMEYTLIHELAHCYDLNFSTTPHQSSCDAWIALHRLEGDTACRWYTRDAYLALSEESQRMETFAITTALYFTDPEKLLRNCPEIFLYLEDLYETDQNSHIKIRNGYIL